MASTPPRIHARISSDGDGITIAIPPVVKKMPDPITVPITHRMTTKVAMARVARYAREIVPSFNAYFYFRIGYWLARRVARLLRDALAALQQDT